MVEIGNFYRKFVNMHKNEKDILIYPVIYVKI